MFDSRRWHGCLSVVSVVCCQVEVSATGRSLVQRSPTECVSECDSEASTMRRPWPPGGGAVAPKGENNPKYVAYLESKERLCIQPAQLFNFS